MILIPLILAKPVLYCALCRFAVAFLPLNVQGLAAVWKLHPEDAQKLAEEIADVGFFERRSAGEAPQYWVPFLYRDALEMVQGAAD